MTSETSIWSYYGGCLSHGGTPKSSIFMKISIANHPLRPPWLRKHPYHHPISWWNPQHIDKYWMKHIPQVPSDLILPSSPPIGSSAKHPSPVSGAVPAAGWGPPARSWGRRGLLGGEGKWDEKKGWSQGKIWNNLEETRIIWKNLEKIGKIMEN